MTTPSANTPVRPIAQEGTQERAGAPDVAEPAVDITKPTGARVVGLRGKPVNRPGGLYGLAVDGDGELVREDGLPVRVRLNGPEASASEPVHDA